MEETLRLARKHGPVVQLVQNLVRKRDFYAGGLIIMFGLLMALKGPSYRVGTMMHMGPGFLPTALGVILIFLGILIAGTALAAPEGEDESVLPEHPEWLGWACILTGPLCFILFGSFFGLIPGTLLACSFPHLVTVRRPGKAPSCSRGSSRHSVSGCFRICCRFRCRCWRGGAYDHDRINGPLVWVWRRAAAA